ncbi:unnamed protein product [Amoebophrya sp. A120]|nr:unnamed protein product [Amoebophrya sp. A120]|eukprot:GSA120T00011058001.1
MAKRTSDAKIIVMRFACLHSREATEVRRRAHVADCGTDYRGVQFCRQGRRDPNREKNPKVFHGAANRESRKIRRQACATEPVADHRESENRVCRQNRRDAKRPQCPEDRRGTGDQVRRQGCGCPENCVHRDCYPGITRDYSLQEVRNKRSDAIPAMRFVDVLCDGSRYLQDRTTFRDCSLYRR